MKLENFKYKFLTAIRYLGDGAFYPFFALYLKYRGLGESKVGMLLSISPLLGIILNPIYTRICKNVNVTKIVLGIISIIEGIMVFILSFTTKYELLFSFTILLAVAGSCHYALMDSLLATYSDVHNINYSSIRLFGSGAYVVATFVIGNLIDLKGYTFAFIGSAILFIIAGVSYLLLKRIDYKKDDTSNIKISVKELLKNKSYVLYLLFYSLLHAAMMSSSSYLSTYLEFRGVSNSDYGLIYSLIVLVETITLIIFTILRKRHYKMWILMLVSALTVTIRMFFYLINAPIIVIAIVSCLRGIGYAFLLNTSFSYVIHLLGEKAGHRGIMGIQLGQGICLAVMNNVNGRIIEANSGTYEMYHLIMLIIGIVLTMYALFMAIRSKVNKNKRNAA